MRAIIFILILAIVVVIGVLASGLVSINQIRGAKAPELTATGNGVIAKGGQAPAFDVETGSVKVGTKPTNVTVPALIVQKPTHNPQSAVANNAQ